MLGMVGWFDDIQHTLICSDWLGRNTLVDLVSNRVISLYNILSLRQYLEGRLECYKPLHLQRRGFSIAG